MKDGLGSISRRSFDAKAFQFQRTWSYSGLHHDRVQKGDKAEAACMQPQEQSCWATMPPELLRDIIQRIEERESSWPSRKDVVACASVCKAWREITKDLVKAPEISGKLTFPISVKQVTPLFILCYFVYSLYLGFCLARHFSALLSNFMVNLTFHSLF